MTTTTTTTSTMTTGLVLTQQERLTHNKDKINTVTLKTKRKSNKKQQQNTILGNGGTNGTALENDSRDKLVSTKQFESKETPSDDVPPPALQRKKKSSSSPSSSSSAAVPRQKFKKRDKKLSQISSCSASSSQTSSSANNKSYKLVPIADIENNASSFSFTSIKRVRMAVNSCFMLPHNEYETVLKRRGYNTKNNKRRRPQQAEGRKNETTSMISEECVDEEEETKDDSLGMKLTLISGRVIVQALNPLSDGRASPAQLTGMISTGDVLVMINSSSLRGLSIDKAVESLQALTSPHHEELVLRFAIGEGLGLLRQQTPSGTATSATEAAKQQGGVGQKSANGGNAVEDDFFSVAQGFLQLQRDFGFVDQLSGMPLFGDDELHQHVHVTETKQEEPSKLQQAETTLSMTRKNDSETTTTTTTKAKHSSVPNIASDTTNDVTTPSTNIPPVSSTLSSSASPPSFVDTIALNLANHATLDKKNWMSKYYLLHNTLQNHLLRFPTSDDDDNNTQQRAVSFHSQKVRREALAEKSIAGAAALCDYIENVDKLKYYDLHDDDYPALFDFKNWKTGGGKSVGGGGPPGGLKGVDEDEEALDIEDLSSSSEDEEEVFGDVFDRVWKERLIHFLQSSVVTNNRTQSNNLRRNAPTTAPSLTDSDTKPPTLELESLFFGSTESAQKLTSRTKSLPSKEVTSHLHSFTTNLAQDLSNSSGGASVASSKITYTSRYTKGTQRTGRTTVNAAKLLVRRVREEAIIFLLLEALPLWMKTFDPLPLTLRYLLFPIYTFDSTAHHHNNPFHTHEIKNISPMSNSRQLGMEEMLGEAKLDPETRVQTCYLTSFYFTHQFFTRDKKRRYANHTLSPEKETDALAFVRKYGSYLKLHPSLVAAGRAHSKKLTEALLDVATYDPKHDEMMNELNKLNKNKDVIVLYEPAMLSAILLYLSKKMFDLVKPRLFDDVVLPLFTSAYPDLKPWQVCDHVKEKHYYQYLTLLLHPVGGNDEAKMDKQLVQEWCTLSTSDRNDTDRMSYFRLVASCNMASKLYYRDLPMLLDLSMTVQDYDLALNLVKEIIFHRKYGHDRLALAAVLDHLRLIAKTTIQQIQQQRQQEQQQPTINDHTPPHVPTTPSLSSSPLLKRVLLSFNYLTSSNTPFIRDAICIPDQILHLLRACHSTVSSPQQQQTQQQQQNIGSLPVMDDNCLSNDQLAFLSLVVNVAKPQNAFEALNRWNNDCSTSLLYYSHKKEGKVICPYAQTLLKRGAMDGLLKRELSGSLLRLKWARLTTTMATHDDIKEENIQQIHHQQEENRLNKNDTMQRQQREEPDEDQRKLTIAKRRGLEGGRIWQKLLDGNVTIEK